MELNFSLVKSFSELGALVVLAYLYVKEKSTDTTNKQIMESQKVQHKKLMTGIENLSIEINKFICVLSGKFVNKENFIDTVNLRFRDIELNLCSKVDKNNIVKNYEEILKEIDLLLEDKRNEIEKEIIKTGNNEIAKEVIKSLEIIFKEYKENIHKLFYYYRENHKAGEIKRAISNLTLNYIQISREILEN